MELTSIYQMDGAPVWDDWSRAARIAAACKIFHPDDEDEQVSDEPRSCCNCRYRRWTATSFSCCKEMTLHM